MLVLLPVAIRSMVSVMANLFMQQGTRGEYVQHHHEQHAHKRRNAVQGVVLLMEEAVHLQCMSPWGKLETIKVVNMNGKLCIIPPLHKKSPAFRGGALQRICFLDGFFLGVNGLLGNVAQSAQVQLAGCEGRYRVNAADTARYP